MPVKLKLDIMLRLNVVEVYFGILCRRHRPLIGKQNQEKGFDAVSQHHLQRSNSHHILQQYSVRLYLYFTSPEIGIILTKMNVYPIKVWNGGFLVFLDIAWHTKSDNIKLLIRQN